MKVLGDRVLAEANASESSVGGLWLPSGNLEVYPTSAWVYGVGSRVQEKVKRGDFILLDEEGVSVSPGYYDVYEIILNDDGTLISILAEIETEPALKEQVDKWRANRSTAEDRMITLKDKKVGESISFNCSDVVDWQFGAIAHLDHDLTYLHVHMMYLINEDGWPALFYMIPEDKILCIVEL